MSKQNRRRFVGAYSEPPGLSISLPFTLDNLRAILAEGAHPDAHYTYQQIKDWADRFWQRYNLWPAELRVDIPAEIVAAVNLAQEIEMQWDIYLANTYTLPEQQHLDFSRVQLPHEWFADCLARLYQLVGPTVSE